MATFLTKGRWAALLGTSAAAALVLAACGGQAETAAPPANSPIGIRTVQGVGTVLADQMGMTLYVTDAEKDGTIKCVEDCAEFWPPLEANGELPSSIEGITGKIGTVKRPDGKTQVTIDSRPLYMFSDDKGAGTAKGNGFEDDFMGTHFVWRAMTANGPAAPDGGSSDTPAPSGSSSSDGGYEYGY
jgi:predicted lipoprotein with Yx(FWY)xxD motif